jgi:hypothetical protein
MVNDINTSILDQKLLLVSCRSLQFCVSTPPPHLFHASTQLLMPSITISTTELCMVTIVVLFERIVNLITQSTQQPLSQVTIFSYFPFLI